MRSANSIRGHLAAAVRHHPEDTDTIRQLRTEHRTSRLADVIRATVDAAPPLTAEQRDHLALILRGGGPDA